SQDSRCAWNASNSTMTPESSPGASSAYRQSSSTTTRLRSNFRGINPLLERLDADAAHGVEEAFLRLALFDVNLQQPRDGIGHFMLGDGGPDDRAERGVRAGGAADGDLVPLLAALIDPEDADVADVMMAAGIHAAGHLEFDFPQVVQVVVVLETL